jgi:hypothetical protein
VAQVMGYFHVKLIVVLLKSGRERFSRPKFADFYSSSDIKRIRYTMRSRFIIRRILAEAFLWLEVSMTFECFTSRSLPMWGITNG